MIVIAETSSLDMGMLDFLFEDFKENFKQVDEYIEELEENDD